MPIHPKPRLDPPLRQFSSSSSFGRFIYGGVSSPYFVRQHLANRHTFLGLAPNIGDLRSPKPRSMLDAHRVPPSQQNWTIQLLRATEHSVVNVDKLTYAANLDNLAPVLPSSRYHFEQVDICDRNGLDRVFAQYRPDAVMHLAAETHVDRSIDGPPAFISTNVGGTGTLLEAARAYWEHLAPEKKRSFRFHHISTDEVFGSLGPTGYFTEASPYAPRSPYSASKASSDMLVRAWHQTFGLPTLISNCSNNYGPYQFPEKLVPTVILAALEQRPIPVYGRGENVRDWLYVGDHADALIAILERGKVGETYLVGGRSEVTNIDLVRLLCRLMDTLIPAAAPYERLIAFVPDRPGHDLRYAINPTKAEHELGWSPSVNLEDGMRRTVEWYLVNRGWWHAIIARGFKAERLGLSTAFE